MLKMSEADWEDMLQKHVAAFKIAAAPEQSELNPVGITVHAAECFAKKHHWEFKLIPVYIGGGIYLRVFQFTSLLDQTVKRIDGEEGEEGEK